MYENFSLRQNMQITQENVYISGPDVKYLDEDFEKLSDDYEIHNPQEIKEFIGNNDELIPYIDKITPIINSHFPNYQKCLTFCQDPEFEELNDITIYINCSESEFDAEWKKLDELEKELFYINEFSAEVKGLISVDLWLT
jgi:hypothetical protein